MTFTRENLDDVVSCPQYSKMNWLIWLLFPIPGVLRTPSNTTSTRKYPERSWSTCHVNYSKIRKPKAYAHILWINLLLNAPLHCSITCKLVNLYVLWRSKSKKDWIQLKWNVGNDNLPKQSIWYTYMGIEICKIILATTALATGYLISNFNVQPTLVMLLLTRMTWK